MVDEQVTTRERTPDPGPDLRVIDAETHIRPVDVAGGAAIGVAGGAAAGAMIGSGAGPAGAVIGAVIGAVAGAAGGGVMGAAIDSGPAPVVGYGDAVDTSVTSVDDAAARLKA